LTSTQRSNLRDGNASLSEGADDPRLGEPDERHGVAASRPLDSYKTGLMVPSSRLISARPAVEGRLWEAEHPGGFALRVEREQQQLVHDAPSSVGSKTNEARARCPAETRSIASIRVAATADVAGAIVAKLEDWTRVIQCCDFEPEVHTRTFPGRRPQLSEIETSERD
jgi:hypothetical protein